MNKFKKIMLGALSALTLGLFVVTGTKVDAATYENGSNGLSYTQSSDNKTKTYDIIPTSEITAAANDVIMDIVVGAIGSGFKLGTSNASIKANAVWYIPVPEGSTGTVSYSATSTSSGRYYLLYTPGETETSTQTECAKPTNISFTSSNIYNYNNGTYLKFGCTGGELKPKGITVTLSTGTFPSAASQYTVSYYLKGSNTAFATEEVVDGKTALGTSTAWGYDISGYYIDAACTTAWTDKTITTDKNIYCEYTAWDSSVYGNGYTLTNAMINNASTSFAIGDDSVALTNTIYSILGKCSFAEIKNGDDTYDSIATGGGFSSSGPSRGISFTVTEPGTISLYVHASSKTVKLTSADGKDTISTSGSISGFDTVEFEVSAAGTYCVGGSGAINIINASFVTTPQVTVTAYQQEAVDGDYTYVRFIFVVSNDTTLATADFASKLTLILDDGLESQQTVTRSPKAYNKITLGGSTYTNGTYEFDNSVNTNDIYVVYVVKFTTATYVGHNIKASLNVNSNDYKTSGYDFK